MYAAPTYQIEVRHPQLNRYRLIRARDRYVVEQKARAQMALWNEQWDRRQTQDSKRRQRDDRLRRHEDMKEEAAELTRE